MLRRTIHRKMRAPFRPGQRILDLGGEVSKVHVMEGWRGKCIVRRTVGEVRMSRVRHMADQEPRYNS